MKATNRCLSAYLLVVSGFTLWVGWFGYLRPHEIERALPWPMPPLHARFVGSLYLAATLFLLLALRARSRLQSRTIVDIAAVWTGWLLLVTLLHWPRFDFSRIQVWYWVVAYVTFPVGAVWLRLASPAVVVPAATRIVQPAVLHLLRGQGALLVSLALALFGWPGSAASFWPWPISPFLAQLYSGPLLALGVGSLLLAARRNWPETLIPSLGVATFALLALLASTWHIGLFTPASVSMVLWFGALGLLAVVSLGLAAGALHAGGSAPARGVDLAGEGA